MPASTSLKMIRTVRVKQSKVAAHCIDRKGGREKGKEGGENENREEKK